MITPRPFQSEAVERHAEILTAGNSSGQCASLEASVAGFGKTYVASFVAKQLGHPMAVLCPKSVIPHWERAAAEVGVPVRFVTNYEQPRIIVPMKIRGNRAQGVSPNTKEINRIKAAKEASFPHGKWLVRGKKYKWTVPKPTLLVFDECHRCKEMTTQNAKLLTAAATQNIPTLMMSATAAQDPLDMAAIGYRLGLHDGADFLGWGHQYGVRRGNFGWEYQGGPDDLKALNGLLFPGHGHRKTFDDIPDFPSTVIDTYPVSDDGAAMKIDALYSHIKELENLKGDAITEITHRLRARQIAEMSKVPALVELVQESCLAGNSAVVFFNFREPIAQFIRLMGAKVGEIGQIVGGQSTTAREDTVQAFQGNRTHCLVAQISAGGVGVNLHDIHAQRPRESFISPPDSARSLIQALGRVRRDGGTPSIQHIMYLRGSVEERVRRAVEKKAHNISLLNDGDLDPLF